MPQKHNKMNSASEELVQLLLSRTAPKLDPEQLPPIPASMLPQPPTIGNPEFLSSVKKLTDSYPEVKRSVSQFRQAPTEASMALMQASKLPIEAFAGTNLAGVFDKRNGQIGINPDESRDSLLEALIHEAAHSQGADELEARVPQLVKEQPERAETLLRLFMELNKK